MMVRKPPYSGPATPRPVADVPAVVAFGANLGDRHQTLTDVTAELERLPLTEDVRMSDPVESVAVTADGPDPSAPAYLNAVATMRTRLAPTILLGYLRAIEDRHGRERHVRWGDRTLDLDLIAYGDQHIDEPGLVVPHPRAATRSFVLAPWLQLDPDAVLPGSGRVADLLTQLGDE